MDGFLCSIILTVVYKYTCSSHVFVKLGAVCVAVDVIVDMFNLFIVKMSTTKLGSGFKWSS